MISCPHCRARLNFSPADAGQIVQCPTCTGTFQAPQSAPVVRDRPATTRQPRTSGSDQSWLLVTICLLSLVSAGMSVIQFAVSESRYKRAKAETRKLINATKNLKLPKMPKFDVD